MSVPKSKQKKKTAILRIKTRKGDNDVDNKCNKPEYRHSTAKTTQPKWQHCISHGLIKIWMDGWHHRHQYYHMHTICIYAFNMHVQ